MMRLKKALVLAVLLPGLLLIAGGCGQQVLPGEISDATAEPGVVVSHPVQINPIDLILVIDQSGTLSGVGDMPATDPEGWRVEAADYLVSNLATKKFNGKVPRIGIVNFGTEAPPNLSLPLASLDSEANINKVKGSLQALNLGWTNFGAAFREAARLFEQGQTFEQGRKAAVVLFTDGEPIDQRRLTVDEYFQEINSVVAATFREQAVDLFVVGIDAADATWADIQDKWVQLLPTEASRAFHLKSMPELPHIYNEIIRILYQIPKVAPEIITDAQGVEFELPAYLERVEFHVFPETKDVKLNIIRPDGTAVSAGDQDVTIHETDLYAIIIISMPEPGRWQYAISEGRGRVEAYRNIIPLRMRLVSPRPLEPLNREQEIKAEFFLEDGSPLAVHPDFPIQVEMTLTDPAGGEEKLLLTQSEPGIYAANTNFIPQMEGTYQIKLEVFAAGAFTHASEYTVDVAALPYLAPVQPVQGARLQTGREPVVEVAMLAAGAPADPSAHFQTPPTSMIIAWLEPATGERSEAYYLRPTGQKGRFATLLPHPLPGGEGQIRFRIVGTMINGENYLADDLLISYHAAVPGWVHGVRVLAVLALLGGLRAFFYFRRPLWRGRLIVEDTRYAGDVTEVSLGRFGKIKSVTVGMDGAIPLADGQFPQLSGVLRMKRHLTEKGMKNVPVLTYRLDKSSDPVTEVLANDGDKVMLGAYIVSYYSF